MNDFDDPMQKRLNPFEYSDEITNIMNKTNTKNIAEMIFLIKFCIFSP